MSQQAANQADRTARYCARLDAHLLTIPSAAERARFCSRELSKWDERYQTFQIEACDGHSKFPPNSPCANDFVLTILAIGQRKTAFEAAVLA
jgi:hypothetical protein